ncbi:MAG: bifunctional oligoribonuclease/PAP phosphatase NrnA [Candidatus Bipolaricaulota bacterium]|nr:bifunctional oligoribonuclease/PAP phosphatase NrnA [Candidatus Bipolaricaulota bacterium]MDW8030622.1 bifunctional oligoribonuclease/PAP phosphatase NrnA [Candidatus Bipolaricaulota bacterium]
MISEIKAIIRAHGRFGILSHIGPEGDAIGSELALKFMLEQLGKETWVANRDLVPPSLRFLPGAEAVLHPTQLRSDEIEVWCIVDCGDLSRIGEDALKLLREGQIIINIDHHHRDNPRFGHVNFVKEAASTTQLLYELAPHLQVTITPQIATCLYTGIVADTDSFRNSNVTPQVLEIAAQLLSYGVNTREIAINLYERRSLSELQLLGYVLQNAQLSGGIIWSAIPKSVFHKTNTSVTDTERLVEELRSVAGIEVAVLFKELENGKIKVSLRSKGRATVNSVARVFGGGGHEQAAGCVIPGDLAEVQERVLAELQRHLSHTLSYGHQHT